MNYRNKKLFSIILSLVLALGIVITPLHSTVLADEAADIKVIDMKKITILHTNDMHGNVEQAKYNTMGMTRLFTKIKEVREENPNTILLDAGDALHGQPISTIPQGESMIKLMNAMGYDAMAAGNHDFNYGYDRLLELTKIAKFPILAANVVKEDGTRELGNYTIKEVDGLKVGIFGLSTPETIYKTKPSNVEGLKFEDPVEVGKKMVEELKKEEVDIIIGLVHLGLEGDYTSEKLASEVEGIDLIVDGHSHTVLENGKEVGDTLIVQTGEKGNNLGVVNIEYGDGKIIKKEGALFLREEGKDLEEDVELKALVDEINKEIQPELETVIGKAKVDLEGERENVRAGETNLGNLLTDMMLKVSGADVVLTNGGGIRASIKAGDITKGDVLEAFSFDNIISVIEVTGVDIKAAIEHGISDYPEPKGAFPHVAGMTYKFDQSKEAGNRVTEILVKGEPIDLNKTYKLATNDFLAIGGDDYEMLKGKKVVAEYDALNQLLMDYIEELGEVDIAKEGRITVIGDAPVVEPEVKPEAPKVEVKEETYVVKPGDVLWKIAEKFAKTWEELAKYNKMKNPHLIFPGQHIMIPAN